MKFLLVDDLDDNLVALEGLLQREGLQLFKAHSGSEALELLLAHDFALALLDVQMPEMNGFELAELMRGSDRTKHVPIIFLTAGSRDPKRMFKGYESGAVDFLYKPLEPHVLKSKADVFFELYRQRSDLQSALRLNELFVGILGHDLRNPLSAMITGVQILQRQLAGQPQQKSLGRMHQAGSRMTEMIEQMLDLTRARLADGLGFVRSRQKVDVAALAQRAADELHGLHPEREVAVEVSGASDSLGDPARLLQLFSNLLANAMTHGSPGTPVRVKVSGNGAMVVEVTNSGTIPPEQLPSLFDPFRGRQKGAATKGEGLGLGLYIAQQIALAHGGQVSVRAGTDGLTTFTVRLPRRAPGEKPAPASGTRKVVLIVDDDGQVCEALREAFEHEGYTALHATNGLQALELLSNPKQRPDVVILDMVLPVVDGAKVYLAMQADSGLKKIPVIVSTSYPQQVPAGAIVVPKPLRLERLLATVADLCRH